MTRIFAGRGLIFLDPMAPELHRLSLPTMMLAVKEHKPSPLNLSRGPKPSKKPGSTRK
jgi:uncharacterized protein YllA (UPF0747 family)